MSKKKKSEPSPIELLEGLDDAVSAAERAQFHDPALKAQVLAILRNYRTPVADTVIFVQQMKEAIVRLENIPEARRLLLLQEASDYLHERDPDERRKIKNALHKATEPKNDEDEQRRRRAARDLVSVAGHEASRPDWAKYAKKKTDG